MAYEATYFQMQFKQKFQEMIYFKLDLIFQLKYWLSSFENQAQIEILVESSSRLTGVLTRKSKATFFYRNNIQKHIL